MPHPDSATPHPSLAELLESLREAFAEISRTPESGSVWRERLTSAAADLPPFKTSKSSQARREQLALVLRGLNDSADDPAASLAQALALVEAEACPRRSAQSAPPLPEQYRLREPVSTFKGFGPKAAEALAQHDIHTLEDLLFFLPRRYEDLYAAGSIRDLHPGELGQALGTIAVMSLPGSTWRGKPFEVLVQDESGSVTLSWFHYGAQNVPRQFHVGDRVLFSGKVGVFRGRLQIVHPVLRHAEEGEEAAENGLIVTYPEVAGLTATRLSLRLRELARLYAPLVEDPLPEALRLEAGLPSLAECVAALHEPPLGADLAAFNDASTPYHQRLAFDELFFVQLALLRAKSAYREQPGFAHKRLNTLARAFYRHFPYRLTAAQKRALQEIVADLTAPRAMNRLLQGDVGSGKTIVAVLSALLVVENGRQVAFMAPTEILAEQHYRSIAPLCAAAGVRVGLVTAERTRTHRRTLYDDIAQGRLQVIIGTHALIQEGVVFKDLGYVIIDEQHRFGVRQRAALREKGERPDCLVMTATPIPRSLTLTLYGDLDVSVLDERPPGRRPIRTVVLGADEWGKLEPLLRREIAAGRQAYVIAPLIDDSEKLDLESASSAHERLSQRYPDWTIGLLHGRLSAEDKDRLMRAFLDGVYDILVATSVVEVGVDVPNATVMVILHAERFGLSQLHQLRGRIGRGEHPSTCFLMVDKLGESARERLSIMEETDNGFRIAEKDLEIRGPGEFLGTKQAGTPLFLHANLVRDQDLLHLARETATHLLALDPTLARPEHRRLAVVLNNRWESRLSLLGIG